MNIRLIAVAATALLGVAACSSTSPQLASAPDVASAPAIDTPVHGAVPAYGDTVLNSDNQPVATRTGLNSDPANPSGVPGHPVSSAYD